MKFYISIIICSLVILTGNSCKKGSDNNVPYTPVDIYIYTSEPTFVNLNAVGGWVYVTGGNRGILVYRKTSTDFMAYDRNCTFQSSNACATINVDASNIIAVDTCCHSQFSMYDGSVLQAPASLPLKSYHTTFDGSVLHIYN